MARARGSTLGSSKVGTIIRSTLACLGSSFLAVLSSTAEAPAHPSDRLVTVGTRIFDVQDVRPDLDLRPDVYEILLLTDVDWIREMLWSDPLTARVVLTITDNTSPNSEPGWHPDFRSDFHPDPTLPPLFQLEGYEVGWMRNEAPVRGDILIYPSDDPKRFYVICAYDRSEPEPGLCSISFHYDPDRNLSVQTRFHQLGLPLPDFAEVAARVEALVRCLDVTEAVRPGHPDPVAPEVQAADLIAGGRCRPEPTS